MSFNCKNFLLTFCLQAILDKLLNRQYNSESDLSKLKTEEFNDVVDPIFSGNKKLQRSLSETLILRGKKNFDNDDEDPYTYEFLRIDSNYNDAIEEALNQKKIIKNDYLSKKRGSPTSMYSAKSKTNTLSASNALKKTPDTDDEIKRIESKTVSSDAKTLTTEAKSTQKKNEFFPKSNLIINIYENFFIYFL